MNATTPLLQLWTRHLHNDELSPEEERQLLATLSEREEFREDLLADGETHGLMFAVYGLHDADDFIERVLARYDDELLADEAKSMYDEPLPEVAPWRPPTAAGHRIVKPSASNSTIKNHTAVTPAKPVKPTIVLSPVQGTGSNSDGRDRSTVFASYMGRWNLQSRRGVWLATSLGLGLVFSLGAILGWWVAAGNLSGGPQQAADAEAGGAPAGPIPPALAPIATLKHCDADSFRSQRAAGDRLSPGPLELLRGDAEIEFDDGKVVSVKGPATLRLAEDSIELDHGFLTAVVPPAGVGFRVLTPTAQVTDQGTEFDVWVEDSGQTEILVRRGDVLVEPWTSRDVASQGWQLNAEKLNLATVYARPNLSPVSPAAGFAKGSRGEFEALISVDGQPLALTSPEIFEQVRAHVIQRFEQSPHMLLRDWSAFVDAHRNGVQGSLELNGVEVQFDGLDDIRELGDSLASDPALGGVDAAGVVGEPDNGGLFRGSIIVNGQKRSFRSKAEYDAARRELLGPIESFGINGLSFRKNASPARREQPPRKPQAPQKQPADEDENPFIPKPKPPSDDNENPFLPK